MTALHQVPTIVIPTVAPLATSTLDITDATAVDSNDLECAFLQEKSFYIQVIEVFAVAAPGNLVCTVFISPDGTNYVQLGLPTTIVATGVLATQQAAIMPFTTHSEFCMLRLQAVAATAASYWTVVAVFSGKK